MDSWDGNIDSQPLSRSIPVGRELNDESIRIIGRLAEEQIREASGWRTHAIQAGELEDIGYGALERMSGDELAADFAHRECAREESMRLFRTGGVAANDAGPNVDPALAHASALGWTGPATAINALIAAYWGDLNQPLQTTPQTHNNA
jgi:hypothetical protein